MVAPGETHQGVKVVSTSGDQAVVEMGGKRHTLRIGEAPASVGGKGGGQASGSRIVLTAGSGGHFMAQGAINGRAVQFHGRHRREPDRPWARPKPSGWA